MRLDTTSKSWGVSNLNGLEDALAWRDSRGGALFWLSHEEEFPLLAIRISGESADVSFFPKEGHPGFRCLGGEGLPRDQNTSFVFEGCDPTTGEDTPNEFVVSLETASSVAIEFFRKKRMSDNVPWFEL